MLLESLNCNNCGAPLQIPPGIEHLTCNHCGTQLAVRRTESISYTEKIAELDERTGALTEQVALLRYQNALAELDRDWDREKERHLVTDQQGRRREPNAVVSTVVAVLMAGCALVWMNVVPQPMHLLAIPILIICLVGGVYGVVKAGNYREARQRYLTRRSRLSPEMFQHETNGEPKRLSSSPPGSPRWNHD